VIFAESCVADFNPDQTERLCSMAKAMLYLGTLKAFYSSSEFWTQDDIFVRVYTDDNTFVRWPAGNGVVKFDNGESNSVNMAIRVDYDTTVRIEVWDRDQPDDDNHPSNDLLGVYHLDRHSPLSGKLVDKTTSSAQYELDYRILTNRIPTLRVLGVRCEKQSAGMNTPLLNGIVGAAKNVSDAAAIALKYNPRPRAKAMRAGFKAASEVLEGVQDFLAYIGQFIEGMDDVYLVHVPPGGDPHVDGRFFPPKDGPKTFQMEKDTEVYFQEQYGSYFRFPIDREDVTIQFREHDPHSFDIDIGRITIPRVPSSASADDLDGSAKIEVAIEFDARENGQGAVYQICYAVGMEDWCLDATVEAQGGPEVMPTPPYPFQDRVTPILTDTAEAWARSVLSLYKPSTSIRGHFDATKRSMTSVQDASYQSVVVDWADSTADVVSIIAVVGGGATVVDISIYAPDQPTLNLGGRASDRAERRLLVSSPGDACTNAVRKNLPAGRGRGSPLYAVCVCGDRARDGADPPIPIPERGFAQACAGRFGGCLGARRVGSQQVGYKWNHRYVCGGDELGIERDQQQPAVDRRGLG
jgi:hypothetical protein